MKVLITGASSFVGAHFALEASKDHEVIATHYSTPLKLPRISSVRVDLCSSRAKLQLRKLDVDVVVHLACKIKTQYRNTALCQSLRHATCGKAVF